MIAKQVIQRAVVAHGYSLAACVIIFRHLPVRPLEMRPDEGSRDAVDCGFHPLAVAVSQGNSLPADVGYFVIWIGILVYCLNAITPKTTTKIPNIHTIIPRRRYCG